MTPTKPNAETGAVEQTAPDLAALLEELKAASKLMDDIAAASEVLPPQYRRKADALGRNLMTLYQTGRRSADTAVSQRVEDERPA